MYINSPSFLDFLPIQGTTEHQVEFSVLYSRFSLIIYFTHSISSVQGFPGGANGKELASRCRRHRKQPQPSLLPHPASFPSILLPSSWRSLHTDLSTRPPSISVQWKDPWRWDHLAESQCLAQRLAHSRCLLKAFDWQTNKRPVISIRCFHMYRLIRFSKLPVFLGKAQQEKALVSGPLVSHRWR